MEKEEAIEKLKIIQSRLKKDQPYITSKIVQSSTELSPYWITKRFRTIGRALRAAGLPSSHLAASIGATKEELLNYLKELRDKLGHPPRAADFDEDEEIYKKYSNHKFSWKIYSLRFGGLKQANKLVEMSDLKDRKEIKTVETEKEEEVIDDKKRFWGRAAEYQALAELLYRGFQGHEIPVDQGLDVFAEKNNKLYHFQVKHKVLSDGRPISLTKSTFEKTGGGDVYYIFVLLSEDKREFLVIPYHFVDHWIRDGVAIDSGKDYLFYIQKRDGKYKFKDVDDVNLNSFLDGWRYIK